MKGLLQALAAFSTCVLASLAHRFMDFGLHSYCGGCLYDLTMLEIILILCSSGSCMPYEVRTTCPGKVRPLSFNEDV